MPDLDLIAYNTAAFICALFVLEFGADKFIDHTAIVARRTGVSQTVIALLTAGAEWEELAVVVVSIARRRPCLAYGNIIGSTISNILGAFSLGLLFHTGGDDADIFDRSSRLYSALLLALTIFVTIFVAFGSRLIGKAAGAVAIAVFAVYLISIGWAISKGKVAAPELSDSDDDGDSSDEDDTEPHSRLSNGSASINAGGVNQVRQYDTFSDTQQSESIGHENSTQQQVGLLDDDDSSTSRSSSNQHGIPYHITLLIIGFLSLTLSAYVLSTAAANLATALGLSDLLFGVVILSIATTLPEKLIAVLSGARGHTGIMVANTVGSNIFLLTLCLGILWIATDGKSGEVCVGMLELGVMLGVTIWMTLTIWCGGWMRGRLVKACGAAMLVAYVGFIVLESVKT